MKSIVLVEDRPWVMRDCIKQLISKGKRIESIIFFHNNSDVPSDVREQLDELKTISNAGENKILPIDIVDITTFNKTLDKYYLNENTIFLFDLGLDGDLSEGNFVMRINVQFARAKEEDGDRRIWFYTNGGRNMENQLKTNFGDHVIEVEDFRDGQIILDIDTILAIAE